MHCETKEENFTVRFWGDSSQVIQFSSFLLEQPKWCSVFLNRGATFAGKCLTWKCKRCGSSLCKSNHVHLISIIEISIIEIISSTSVNSYDEEDHQIQTSSATIQYVDSVTVHLFGIWVGFNLLITPLVWLFRNNIGMRMCSAFTFQQVRQESIPKCPSYRWMEITFGSST